MRLEKQPDQFRKEVKRDVIYDDKERHYCSINPAR